jgi:hypothetical protein
MPSAARSAAILKPESRRSPQFNTDFGKAYVHGNVVEGNDQVTADNWDGGVQVDREDGYDPKVILPAVRINKPYPHSYLEIQPAGAAYEHVLANAGATRPRRDAVDERVVNMVRTGTVSYEEGQGIITDVNQVGGYPEYQGEPYADADNDGMPDDWESRYGLDPNDSADAAADLNGDGYTNIEEFLNGLDPTEKGRTWQSPRNYVDLFWNI